jgi:hypothetical protein
MLPMLRAATFITIVFNVSAAFAQTPPPGMPFNTAKHPNPIITFVELKDFKPVASDELRKETDIELLGLAQDEAKRESLEMAPGRFVKNMNILSIRTDVTFYPVVKQTFKLNNGQEFMLHSFRFPKVTLPDDFTRMVLNEAAIERKKKPAEMRFGGAKPETLEIRGARGLLFEEDGMTVVYWQENGVGHTATSSLSRTELFEVIEDLL